MKNIMTIQELILSAQGAGADLVGNSKIQANGLVGNTTLRYDEWKQLDDNLIRIARQRLQIVDDLRSAGLVKSLGGIGVITSQYERLSDMTAANADMDGATQGQKDRPTFDLVGVPVPVFHKEFSINARQLAASRTRGEALDTTAQGIAARRVFDLIEDSAFNGLPGVVVDGNTVYGLTTHPNRNTVSHVASWATATAAQIVSDVQTKYLPAMYADNQFGPFTLYVAKNIWANIQGDYSVDSSITIKDRIENFADIAAVKPGDSLAAGNAVMVSMNPETIDLAVGQDVRNLQWNNDPMINEFKVYGVMVVRVKADKDGKSGVVHGS